MSRTRCLLAVVALVANGCAFGATSAPDPNDPDKPCNTSEATPIMDGAWAVVFGISMGASINEATMEFSDDEAVPLAVMTGVVTALFAYSAYRGFDNIGQCRERQTRLAAEAAAAPTVTAQLPSRRQDAWEATKRAKTAARAGDCATVSTFGEVVFNIDPEFHMAVFVRDPAIAQCLTASQPLAPEPAPPTSQPSPPPPSQPPPSQPPPLKPAAPSQVPPLKPAAPSQVPPLRPANP